jgi:hypothetical protein
VTFLLKLVGWATLFFLPAWIVQHPYQGILGALVARMVAPPGATIEWVDLELFYPFDLAIYAAMTFASDWAPWSRRWRSLLPGIPAMVLIEIVALAIAMGSMLAAGAGNAAAADAAQRFATGVIRVTGLVAAAGVWFFFVGRERLSLAARTWLGA